MRRVGLTWTAGAAILWACLLGALPAEAQVRALLGLSSCAPLDGPATLYLAPSTCVDPTEAAVVLPVQGLVSLTGLACRLSGASGSASVTVTLRSGACGALADTALACTIAPGGQQCSTGSAFVAVTPGQCLTFKVAISAAFPAPRYVTCSVERAV